MSIETLAGERVHVLPKRMIQVLKDNLRWRRQTLNGDIGDSNSCNLNCSVSPLEHVEQSIIEVANNRKGARSLVSECSEDEMFSYALYNVKAPVTL